MDKNYKFYLTGKTKIRTETKELVEKAAALLHPPDDKQVHLMYMSSILVSTGTNLNNAHFLPSELLKAEGTIVNKALDVEHSESEIIGHQIERVYRKKSGEALDLVELSSEDTAVLESRDFDIEILSIVYRDRFPELSEEIAKGEWDVSMECYYKDFDVKVGDLIIPRAAAEAVGINVLDSSIYGKSAKVFSKGKELAEGTLVRVLRDICFSGCGIVKNPANVDSIILEAASVNDNPLMDDSTLEITLLEETSNNKLTSVDVDNVEISASNENSDIDISTDVEGICVSYKRLVEEGGQNVVKDWCSEFSSTCTSSYRSALDADCLRNKALSTAAEFAKTLFEGKRSADALSLATAKLKQALNKTSKFNK